MASPSAFNIPPPRHAGVHRSFTLPNRLGEVRPSSSAGQASQEDIETLFESPKCKIVSFSPAEPKGRSRTVSLGASDVASLPVGELPYGSNTERTMAIGPLRVYRVPSSVAFLNSGKLVHPVLPKSSCWCVDGKTKFVLGVPGKKYYRIELPGEDDADHAKADEFKLVLAKISQYETTPCPFKRGFYVELPDMAAATPKRPWKPKHTPGVTTPWSPEGQQRTDGAYVERRFHSPVRGTSQSPRRPYTARSASIEPSDTDSVSNLGREEIYVPRIDHSKVPHLVATYDEFGPALVRGGSPETPSWTPDRRNSDIGELRKQASIPSILEEIRNIDEVEESTLKETEISVDVGLSTGCSDAGDSLQREPEAVEREVEDHSGLPSPQVSSGKKSTPPRLHFKKHEEGTHWLDSGDNEETPTAARPFPGMRSVTAPVFGGTDPERAPPERPQIQVRPSLRRRLDSGTESLASIESTSSFHSFHSPTSPDSYTDSLGITTTLDEHLATSESVKTYKRENIPASVTIDTTKNVLTDLSTPTWPAFSPNNDADEDTEAEAESDTKSFMTAASPSSPSSPPAPPSPEHRLSRTKSASASLRIGFRHRRTQSPMPPQANIYVPPSSLSGHLTNILLNKTASLLLGPPVQLVALMLNLARRFADGNLKGESYTYGAHGQPIPCEWCDSDLDVGGESSEEDDYGISIGGTPEKRIGKRRGSEKRKKDSSGRWDLD